MIKSTHLLTKTVLLLTFSIPIALAQDDRADGDDSYEQYSSPMTTISDDLIVEGRICSSDQDMCVEPGENFLSYGPSGFQLEYKAKDNSPAIGFEVTGAGDADWVIGSNGNDDLRFEYDENPGGAGDSGLVMALRVPGLVGINELNPEAPLHVVGDNLVLTAVEEVLILESEVAPQQVFYNATTGSTWFFAMTSDDQFKVSRDGTGKVEAKFFDNGNLALAGTLIQGSDATNKTAFTAIDPASILDIIAKLPITEWNYIGDQARHVGPTAQDFAAAFGLGDTDTGIAAIDADGVALAAIKALAAENNALKARIDALAGTSGTRSSLISVFALILAAIALALIARTTFTRRRSAVDD